GNPAIYFQPPGSGDWLTPPNILAWDPEPGNPPDPAVQINSGVQTSSQINNVFILRQARGEFRIGNGETGYPWLDVQQDGTFVLGLYAGDTNAVGRAVVRGRSDGTWRIGRHNVYINNSTSTGEIEARATGHIDIRSDRHVRLHGVAQGGSEAPWGVYANGGFSVNGPKNFLIPHPSKPGMELSHGATESPVWGIEYWGTDVLDDTGRVVVELPDYFEALAKERNRVVLVTPQGGAVKWIEIEDGKFTVTGQPGQKLSWLVKAERHGADFPVELPATNWRADDETNEEN